MKLESHLREASLITYSNIPIAIPLLQPVILLRDTVGERVPCLFELETTNK
jgi:hypothetical protein